MLCCAVLCCAVMCYKPCSAMLGCAALRSADVLLIAYFCFLAVSMLLTVPLFCLLATVRRCAVTCCAALVCSAVLCCVAAVLCCALQCFAALCCCCCACAVAAGASLLHSRVILLPKCAALLYFVFLVQVVPFCFCCVAILLEYLRYTA